MFGSTGFDGVFNGTSFAKEERVITVFVKLTTPTVTVPRGSDAEDLEDLVGGAIEKVFCNDALDFFRGLGDRLKGVKILTNAATALPGRPETLEVKRIKDWKGLFTSLELRGKNEQDREMELMDRSQAVSEWGMNTLSKAVSVENIFDRNGKTLQSQGYGEVILVSRVLASSPDIIQRFERRASKSEELEARNVLERWVDGIVGLKVEDTLAPMFLHLGAGGADDAKKAVEKLIGSESPINGIMEAFRKMMDI